MTKPKEFNLTKGSSGSEQKLKTLEKNDIKVDVFIQDVTYGDALNYLHDELHKFKL